MLKNYLKISLRNLANSKAYSLINVLGLAIGLTCCLLIMLYVKQELTFDQFHENAERIYRIGVENTYPDRVSYYSQTPAPLAPAFRLDYPEIEHLTRVYFAMPLLMSAADKRIIESDVIFAEKDFFNIFTFPVIAGDPHDLLAEPDAIVLTKSMAHKYFGDENPVGRVLRCNNKYDFKVKAVVADVPVTSHFDFDCVISFEALNEDLFGVTLDQWGAYVDNYTYYLKPEHLDVAEFEQRVAAFVKKHAPTRPNLTRKLFFQPLTDIHLYAHNQDEIRENNYVSTLITISAIGFFILLIACINFMNLSTARSTRRAKEVGVRKVLGAVRPQLVAQFLGESLFVVMASTALSLMLAELALPYFSQLIGREIDFVFRENRVILAALIVLTIVVGLVSGLYPALVLSGFRPVAVVKGLKSSDGNSKWPLYFRKALVVTQFAISIILLFGALVLEKQLRYALSADLGFKREQTVVISMFEEETADKYEPIKRALLQHPNVLQATAAFRAPIANNVFDTSAYPKGYDGDERFNVQMNFVDFDFVENYGIELLAGRNFSPEFATDLKEAFVINETLARRLGAREPQQVLGTKLPIGINGITGTVIGVVEDFHISSMHEPIQPLVMMHWPGLFNQISVTIRPANMSETIAFLEETWKKHEPAYPFKYEFLDDTIRSQYESVEQTLQMVKTFSGIAIFIACLGLFGLSAFMAEQRTKEIGVRKVLGASVRNIVALLSKDFVKLVLVAGIVAAPIARMIMDGFLDEYFAYRISADWITAFWALMLALAVALLTVSYQAMRTALLNPVETLRYE